VPSAPASVTAVQRRLSAPGWLFNGTALALFVIALWRGSERGGDIGSIFLIASAWFALLLAWLFWAVAAAGGGGASSSLLLRWILAPSLFVLAAALVFGGYALEARFRLSEGALRAAAEATAAGRPVGPGWIGLYAVDEVSMAGASVRFAIPGQHAIVRGSPVDRRRVWYEPLADGWWYEVDASDWFVD
jgi:hypothetical protein